MSVVAIETVGSLASTISIDNPSIEVAFTVAGSFNDAEIRAALENELPATKTVQSAFFGSMTLYIQTYQFKQRPEGGSTYDGTATYGRTQPRKTGQLWFSFDGTGGTAHIQTSLETVASYGRAQLAGPPTGLTAVSLGAGNVPTGTKYYVVTAVSVSGETAKSSEASVVLGGDSQVGLSWNAVTNASSYKIYRTTASGTYTTPALVGTSTGTTFTDISAEASAGAPPAESTALEPPNFQNAIGVSDTAVEGVDKVVPYFRFRLDYYPATALMTPEYILKLYLLTGKTNNEVVNLGGIEFDIGTLLFMGPTGQPRGFDDWELGLSFIASPNVTGISLGEITGIEKQGHDYLWARYIDSTDRHSPIKIPQFAFVERIYEPGDFNDFGLNNIPIQGLAGQ